MIRHCPDPLEVFLMGYWDGGFPGVLGIGCKAAINIYF
jgi:hypothetical protein